MKKSGQKAVGRPVSKNESSCRRVVLKGDKEINPLFWCQAIQFGREALVLVVSFVDAKDVVDSGPSGFNGG